MQQTLAGHLGPELVELGPGEARRAVQKALDVVKGGALVDGRKLVPEGLVGGKPVVVCRRVACEPVAACRRVAGEPVAVTENAMV